MIFDLSNQPNGEVKRVEVVYPAESGHFYDKVTGKQIEFPRGTWTKTKIAAGGVPGVTTIIRQLALGRALEKYEGNRFIDCTAEEMQAFYDEFGYLPESSEIRELVWESVQVKKDDIFGRGKELHATIERYAQGESILGKWQMHLEVMHSELHALGIDFTSGSSEHSFATERYGGKIDWHNDAWLLDFKTKERLTGPDEIETWDEDDNLVVKANPKAGKLKKLAYPEHAQQLAAYAFGLRQDAIFTRCANVFVGVDDAAVHVHEWTPEQIFKGWRKFEHLLNYWWEDKQP